MTTLLESILTVVLGQPRNISLVPGYCFHLRTEHEYGSTVFGHKTSIQRSAPLAHVMAKSAGCDRRVGRRQVGWAFTVQREKWRSCKEVLCKNYNPYSNSVLERFLHIQQQVDWTVIAMTLHDSNPKVNAL